MPEARFLHTTLRTDDGIDVVIAGEVDATCSDDLHRIVLAVLDARPGRITIDMRGLVFIDSAGVAALVSAHEVARGHEIRLAVSHARGQVRQALADSGALVALTTGGPAAE
jgi:anti-sigma B factor antagonist